MILIALVQTIYGRNVSKLFVLFASTRNGKEEYDDPWNANLSPHFEVDGSKSGVQTCTHEVVVEEVAGHANLCSGPDSVQIGKERNTKAIDHGNRHDMTIIVNDFCETENVVVMQDSSGK